MLMPRAHVSPSETKAAKAADVALYALMTAVPCMGYSLSSSYTQSDGVFFFGFNLPELLPKNDPLASGRFRCWRSPDHRR